MALKGKSNEAARNLVKNYRRLGFRKFFQAWGRGIEGITPFQQVKGELKGQVIILVGTIWGVIYMGMISSKAHTWWVFVMLVGGLIVLLFTMVGTMQKYMRLRIQDKMVKEAMQN
jgi:hypothetical protein